MAAAALKPVRDRAASSVPKPRRLLLLRPDHLGDVLLTSPAVALLRRALPDAHLTMMVGPWSAEVAKRDPMLDEVLPCPFPGFTRSAGSSPLAPYRLLWQTAAKLRRARFDAALILRFDHWWGAWLSALAGVPVRVGFGVGESTPFITHALDPAQRGHWTEQALAVAGRSLTAMGVDHPGPAANVVEGRASPTAHRTAFPLRFAVGASDSREADLLLDPLGLGHGHGVVAVHPGTGSPLKLWPEERWVGLGRLLTDRGLHIILTGSEAEAPLVERIAGAIPGAASLAGQTGLGALAALFQRCGLVVGVDNGPLHLAVAMGVLTVHLFGPTDPALYGPWGDAVRHRVVAGGWPGAPCGRLDVRPPGGGAPPCMQAITVEQVAEACLELMRDDG